MNAPLIPPELRGLYAAAAIGKDAEEFVRSELGRTVLGMAKQDAAEAMNDLKKTSPFMFWKVQRLQNEIRIAEQFEKWLVEIITEGAQALHQLEEPPDV